MRLTPPSKMLRIRHCCTRKIKFNSCVVLENTPILV